MCFDLLSVTRLTPTCGCLHLSDQKRSYIWMGVVEISTHSGGSQQEALNTKIFSSTQQRPLGSTHIASLPALVSSRSANNTLFFPNKSSRVQKKLGFWQKFAFFQLASERATEVRKHGRIFFVRTEMLEVWIFTYVPSGNCSGISSMFLMLSELPETEFHLLIQQPPVSALSHSHALSLSHTNRLQQFLNTKK